MLAHMCRLVLTLMLAVTVSAADWKKDVVFRATFDGSLDAKVAKGDPRLYSAADYKKQSEAKPGLAGTPVEVAKGIGRNGDALRFTKKNTNAVFYHAKDNVPFDPKNWSGTVSFWLKLDPDKDLEPGFCDPIQITDKAYNDSAIWVDFTKDDKPRHFRLGVFGALKSWHTTNTPPDTSPNFNNRLVTVKQPQFASGKWTHVAISYSKLGSGEGEAKLYVGGKLMGTTPRIAEIFDWDLEKSTIRLGVNYVGLLDDVAIFNRHLDAHEIEEIAAVTNW